jgi:hypothetical protein
MCGPRDGGNLNLIVNTAPRGSSPAKESSDEELTSCDAQTGHEVVYDRPDSRLPLERSPEGGNEAVQGHKEDERNIDPVDMLVPIVDGHGLFSDVRFRGIILLAPGRRPRRRLGGLLWCSRGHNCDMDRKAGEEEEEEGRGGEEV